MTDATKTTRTRAEAIAELTDGDDPVSVGTRTLVALNDSLDREQRIEVARRINLVQHIRRDCTAFDD